MMIMQFTLVMQFTLGAKRLSVSGSTALAAIYSSAILSVSGSTALATIYSSAVLSVCGLTALSAIYSSAGSPEILTLASRASG